MRKQIPSFSLLIMLLTILCAGSLLAQEFQAPYELSVSENQGVVQHAVPIQSNVVSEPQYLDATAVPHDGFCLPEEECLAGCGEYCHECGGQCSGGCCLQKMLTPEKRAEIKHSLYLKSMTAGTAQYTHQWNRYHAQQLPWNGNYNHSQWGKPLPLVVPPTAAFQTKWSWGVGRNTVTPIYHQFGRPYPGEMSGGGGGNLRTTPRWPSHTDQFGVYYVRAPW